MTLSSILPINSITRELFNNYCAGPFTGLLASMQCPVVKGSEAYNNMAAIALGASGYAELLCSWARRERIGKGVHAEVDQDRTLVGNKKGVITFKSNNIIFVFNPMHGVIVGMPLRAGEEKKAVSLLSCRYSYATKLYLPINGATPTDQDLEQFNAQSDENNGNATLKLRFMDVPDLSLSFTRNQTGVTVCLVAEDGAVLDSMTVSFEGRQPLNSLVPRNECVNLADETIEFPKPVFTWLRSDGENLYDVAVDEENSPSDYMATSVDDAIRHLTEWSDDNRGEGKVNETREELQANLYQVIYKPVYVDKL